METDNRNESTRSTRSKEKKIERIRQKEILITEQGETRILDILNHILCSRYECIKAEVRNIKLDSAKLVVMESKKQMESRRVKKKLSEETEDKTKFLVKELNKKMAIMDSLHQEEMDRVQDSHVLEVAHLLSDHQELTTKLSAYLMEKGEQLEIMRTRPPGPSETRWTS